MKSAPLPKDLPAWSRKCRTVSFILPLLVAITLAGPKIAFVKKTVDAGIAVEGSAETLKADFSMKNTGSSAVKLKRVIPACGCTKITYYDSLIQPGKSGKIETALNLKGFPGGPLAKAITVVSNAENDSIVRLIVKATVQPIIDISAPYITMNVNDSARMSIYLSSKRADLKVSEIFFMEERETGQEVAANWQADVPRPIRFQWTPVDSKRSDGYRDYRLDLFMPKINKSMLGEFLIKTNHPDRQEIFMRGTLLK